MDHLVRTEQTAWPGSFAMEPSWYIYCIRLPLPCKKKSSVPQSLASFPGLSFEEPENEATRHEIVKVGISQNPARRLHEIMDVFQELGMKQPLLKDLRSTDSPEEAIQKAKSIDNIVFLVKVTGTQQDVETAERDIRTFGTSLGQDFIDSFTDHVCHEKKNNLRNFGMTEWILAHSGLVSTLWWKFRSSQLYSKPFSQQNLLEHLSGKLQPPTGKEFCKKIRAHCLSYACGTLMVPPDSVIISFQPMKFYYTFKNDKQ